MHVVVDRLTRLLIVKLSNTRYQFDQITYIFFIFLILILSFHKLGHARGYITLIDIHVRTDCIVLLNIVLVCCTVNRRF